MIEKKGISLTVLVITIVILIVILEVTIIQINNGIGAAEKTDFVTELATIQDKIKEYYLLSGNLPVQSGVRYDASEIDDLLNDVNSQQLLESEINANEDANNKFFVVDLDKISVETNDRGVSAQGTDVFLVASNTLNVYYLQGVELEGIIRFSLVTLTDKNIIQGEQEKNESDVDLDNELRLEKNTDVWVNEIVITIKNTLQSNESLQYSIAGANAKSVVNNKITLNANNMTDTEKTLFSTSKLVTVNKIIEDAIVETKTIDISNLDIAAPSLGNMSMTDTSNQEYNLITIDSLDQGLSGVNYLCYDYNNALVNSILAPYYSNASKFTKERLLSVGKRTYNGSIRLAKNIKSISVIAVDYAGNISETITYTIDDKYLVSE